MTMRIVNVLTPLLITFAAGCGNVRHTAARWGEFESHRFTNGTVQIEVVPAIGRIVSYGKVDGPNLLWTDLAARDHVAADWTNWGGDKIWLWPQDKWKERTDKTWPPPTEKLEWTSHVDAGSITLVSSPVPGWDVQIWRDIRMNRSGSLVKITNKLVPVANPTRLPDEICLWQITQVRVPDKLTAVALPGTLRQMDPNMTPWTTIKPVGALLEFTRPPNDGAKVGFDAHQISALFNQTWFIQRMAHVDGGTYRPGERAQIFSLANNDPILPKDVPPYVELEYTAPFANGGYAPLIIQWELK